GRSVRKLHTVSGGAWTTKVLEISIAMRSFSPASARSAGGSEELLGMGEELLPATWIAEVERLALVLGPVLGGGDPHRHPAHRVDGLLHRGRGRGNRGQHRLIHPGAVELDDLRQHAERHLFRKAGTEVESGRALDALQGRRDDATAEQCLADLPEARP